MQPNRLYDLNHYFNLLARKLTPVSLPWMILKLSQFLGTYRKAGGVWNILILFSQQNIDHRVPPIFYDYFMPLVLHSWSAKKWKVLISVLFVTDYVKLL